MKLQWPIDNVHLSPSMGPIPYDVYISQVFGADPVAKVDTWYGKFLVKAGEHVYKVLAGQDGHNGYDIAAPLGAPLKGNILEDEAYIIYQSHDAGYGNTTVVRVIDGDRNYALLFGHQQKFEPDIEIIWNWNDKSHPLILNQIFGYVNSTGASTGNHLHFGVYEYDINGNKLNSNNGFGGAIDPLQFITGNSMQLIKDQGVVYLVSGVNQKIKTGIADMVVEAGIFGDEPVVDGDTSAIPETHTIAQGFIINKKG